MTTYQKFVKTNENWHPNFDGDLIRVQYNEIAATKNYSTFIRIFVCGNDNEIAARDYLIEERKTALEMYKLIDDYVTKQDLADFGFIF